MMFARLCWGSLVSPLYWRNYVMKFFPPPRKSVYKQLLTNSFSRN